jgi:hypothetical protein
VSPLGHVSLDTTNIYAETDMATKKRALATIDQGRTGKTSGGWSRRPEVMEFPSLAVASQICGAEYVGSAENRARAGSAPHIGMRHILVR